MIEGYPGSFPCFPALCCTPASLREFFKETASDAMAINYDPSHLMRMGIDPVRFLGGICRPRRACAWEGHGNDGRETLRIRQFQPATLASRSRLADMCGDTAFRATAAPMGKILSMLKDAKYKGMVSIELEDKDFNGTEEGKNGGCSRAGIF